MVPEKHRKYMNYLNDTILCKSYSDILNELLKLCKLSISPQEYVFCEELNCHIFNYVAYEKIIIHDLEFVRYKFNDHVFEKGWEVRLFCDNGVSVKNNAIISSTVYNFMKKAYLHTTPL